MAEMITEECCVCGIKFAITKIQHTRLNSCKNTFYCPNGHGQSYVGESDDKKIKRLHKELKSKQETIIHLRECNKNANDRVDRLRATIRGLKISRGQWRGRAQKIEGGIL